MEVRTLEHKDIEKDVAPEEVVSVNFIEAIINKDNETGKYELETSFDKEKLSFRLN